MNSNSQVMDIFIEEIIPNRFQPRLSFDEKKINELAASIKVHGIIQPLVLRRIGDKYEIIAGERRFKAATMVGLNKVPAIIVEMDDTKSAEVALVENLQRKDLSAIETAKSFKKILDMGQMTQEQLAEKMGVSQSSVANKLRLLNLDEKVQQALLEEKISERHARSMLSTSDYNQQQQLLEKVINERLTVKQLDEEIKTMLKGNGIEKVEVFEEGSNVESFDLSENENNSEKFEFFDEKKPDIIETSPNQEPIKEVFSFDEPIINTLETANPEKSIFTNGEPIIDLSSNNVSDNLSNVQSIEEMTILTEAEKEQAAIINLDQAISELQPDNENPEPLIVSEKQPEEQTTEVIKEIEIKIDKNNFRTVEEAFDNLKKDIENAGLRIDMDTYNFEQYYQLIIKVYK